MRWLLALVAGATAGDAPPRCRSHGLKLDLLEWDLLADCGSHARLLNLEAADAGRALYYEAVPSAGGGAAMVLYGCAPAHAAGTFGTVLAAADRAAAGDSHRVRNAYGFGRATVGDWTVASATLAVVVGPRNATTGLRAVDAVAAAAGGSRYAWVEAGGAVAPAVSWAPAFPLRAPTVARYTVVRHPYARLLSAYRRAVLDVRAPSHVAVKAHANQTESEPHGVNAVLGSARTFRFWARRRFVLMNRATCPVAVAGVPAGTRCDPRSADGAGLCCLNVPGEGARIAPQALWAKGADHVLRYETLADDFAACDPRRRPLLPFFFFTEPARRLARAYGLENGECMRREPKAVLRKKVNARLPKGMGRRDSFISTESRVAAHEDLKRAHWERSTRHYATRLRENRIPADVRREADAAYAADFATLGYLAF